MTETAGAPTLLNLDELVWPVRHQPVFAANGIVATSQPLAAGVGTGILREGGSAVDAAVAMAAALTVVEAPTSSIGGDAFALVWDGERLHGLNGSGRAPSALTADVVRERGYEAMPERGWLPVTIPGVPAAWRDLHQRFGRLPFRRLLEPASDYAERGHAVSPISAWHWQWEVDEEHPKLRGDEVAGFVDLYGRFAGLSYGSDGTRTRDLRRDRPVRRSRLQLATTRNDRLQQAFRRRANRL